MADPHFNAFGTPLVPVELLTLDEKLRLLLADMPQWQYGHIAPFVGRWFAAAFEACLRGESDDLMRLLGLRPPKGSTRTAQRIERMRERDALLVRLSVAAGSDARARRILAGAEDCPKRCKPLVDALKAHRIPRSKTGFIEAKKVQRHRR